VCTLCMGYFNDACTIIECLHTFCRVCIMRHFRDSSMCPQCEAELGTNPKDLVRTDRTLQSIVDKVFPPFPRKVEVAASSSAAPPHPTIVAADDTAVDTQADAANPADSAGSADTADAIHAPEADASGWDRRSATKADGSWAEPAKKVARTDSTGGQASDTASAEAAATTEEEISFSLQELEGSRQHLSALEKPYLRTKSLLTVGHLRKYLGKKMGMPPDDVDFYCLGQELESSTTLDVIARTLWKDDGNDLVLGYFVR